LKDAIFLTTKKSFHDSKKPLKQNQGEFITEDRSKDPFKNPPFLSADGKKPCVKSNIKSTKERGLLCEPNTEGLVNIQSNSFIPSGDIVGRPFETGPEVKPDGRAPRIKADLKAKKEKVEDNFPIQFSEISNSEDEQEVPEFTNKNKFVELFPPNENSRDISHLVADKIEAFKDELSGPFESEINPFTTSRPEFITVTTPKETNKNDFKLANQKLNLIHVSDSKCEGNPFKCPPKNVVDGRQPRVKSNIKASSRNFFFNKNKRQKVTEKQKPDRENFKRFLANFKARKGKESQNHLSEIQQSTISNTNKQHSASKENSIQDEISDSKIAEFPTTLDQISNPYPEDQEKQNVIVKKKSRRQKPFTRKIPRKNKILPEENLEPNEKFILPRKITNSGFQVDD